MFFQPWQLVSNSHYALLFPALAYSLLALSHTSQISSQQEDWTLRCPVQAVLSAVLTNGTISKLPDDLQWQIRSLLPRKEAAAPRLPQPGGQASPQAGGLMMIPEGQAADPSQAVPASGALNLAFLPLMTQVRPLLVSMSPTLVGLGQVQLKLRSNCSFCYCTGNSWLACIKSSIPKCT